ncbi:hypothetical protein H8356DRAFT_1292938 [Neocallimastix lanati (nom. inval.)]|nr:hypothetical protein H8356DRAFT_1292938 [Neocallimastix sp. JGI-2020a]
MNKNLILIEDIIDEDLYQSIINNNNNDYCCIESKIINSPVHGDLLSDLVKYNYSIGETDFQSKSYSGISIELMSVTTGNINMVSKLIKLNASDFSTPSYNGMTPFLMALLNKDQDMLNLLLNHPHKIGDINYTNELNKTYLYYTCLYNMPNIAKRILLLTGKMDILDKKNSRNQLVKRKYHSAIIDECDNSFLDTALNSARITYTSKYHYNWVYVPIFNYANNTVFPTVTKLREIINQYEGDIHQNELLQIKDKKKKIRFKRQRKP